MNHYHVQLIDTIREAYQALQHIPEDSWQADGYCNRSTGRCDMFGWYVRHIILPGVDPGALATSVYRVKAAPLSHAINVLLEYCIPPESNPYDAYSICIGYHPAFQQETPRERSLACLKLILDRCDVAVPPLNKIAPQPQQSQPRPDKVAAYPSRPMPSLAERYYPKA